MYSVLSYFLPLVFSIKLCVWYTKQFSELHHLFLLTNGVSLEWFCVESDSIHLGFVACLSMTIYLAELSIHICSLILGMLIRKGEL